jgi:hypothetical protein
LGKRLQVNCCVGAAVGSDRGRCETGGTTSRGFNRNPVQNTETHLGIAGLQEQYSTALGVEMGSCFVRRGSIANSAAGKSKVARTVLEVLM